MILPKNGEQKYRGYHLLVETSTKNGIHCKAMRVKPRLKKKPGKLIIVGERFGLGFLRELLAGAFRVPSPIGELGTILVLWAAYSVLEFIAYLGLAGSTRTFMGASINLVGVILAYRSCRSDSTIL